MAERIGILVAASIIGAFAGALTGPVINNVPGRWLVDYGETALPDPESGFRRVNTRLLSPVLAIFMSVGSTASALTHSFSETIIIISSLWLLMIVAIVDYKYMIIPDQALVMLAVIGLINVFIRVINSSDIIYPDHTAGSIIIDSLKGMFIASVTYLVIAVIGSFFAGKAALGFGDIKLLAVAGFLCGSAGAVFIIICTAMLSSVSFSLQMLFSKLSPGDEKALGPYIALSCAVYLLVL